MLQPAQTHDGLKFDATTIQDVLYGYTNKTASYALNWIRSYGLQEGRDYWRYASKEVRSDGQPRSVRYQFSLPATATIINRSKNRKVKAWFNIQYKDQLEATVEPEVDQKPETPVLVYDGTGYDQMTNTHSMGYRNLRDGIGQPEAIEEEPTIIQEEKPVSTALQVNIQGVELQQIVYKDEPVVTYQQIADVHGISLSNVQHSFSRHKERFVEGKHYFRLSFAEVNSHGLSVSANSNGITLFTQKGYLLLTKPMGDDRSWQVQEQMIDQYFTMREAVQSGTLGLSDHALANILAAQQQGTLAVLARIEEYKHENQMAAARAEDRFAGLVEAYGKTNDRLTALVERLAERPVEQQPAVRIQAEPAANTNPYGLVEVCTWSWKHCRKTTPQERTQLYAECREISKRTGRQHDQIRVKGKLFPIDRAEPEVCLHAAQKLNLLKVG